MRNIFLFILMAGVISIAGKSYADESLSVEQAVLIAVKANPGLAAKNAQARAMAEVPPQAGSLPDPVLSLNAMSLPIDTFSITDENMTQLQVGVAQELPFPGKLELREQAAKHKAKASLHNASEYLLQLKRNVRIGWWNLFYLDRALEIVDLNKDLLRGFIRIAQIKYKVGKGLQQDVLLAQLELSKLIDIEIELGAARRNVEASFNALLNRPATVQVKVQERINEDLPSVPDEPTLASMAVKNRPELASKQEDIAFADAYVGLAKKDYYPDFKLGAIYGNRSGDNPVSGESRSDLASVMLSMNLPIFTSSRQDRKLEQQLAERARTEFSFQDAREAILAEVSRALADYKKAHEQALLFKNGIIPQATQTVASMLAGYQVNKVDFLNLVRAQVTLYNYETQYWKKQAEANQAVARINAAVGKEIIHE
ncbi:Heavy metal RND efflux outer membrane protein, CzcC family [hydrothermal vent metagenome]|uniref:Heavy metal RND efflux outer membrane protein, CzcC family n=1 Tax=hydrothermal vent metagenome TaxID=652676 RepID=A0A3B1C0J4_9ZZZZ